MEIVNILQEDGTSDKFKFRYGSKISDTFPCRIWIYSLDFSTAIGSVEISEPDLNEWIKLEFPNGEVDVAENSSYVINVTSECDLRWLVSGIDVDSIDPETLPEDDRNKIESYPEGAIKVGIGFR